MKKNEYQCEWCKGIFEKGWTDEEAEKEAKTIFGKNPNEWRDKSVLICDDCFTQMYPPAHPDLLEKTKKQL